jgi:prevent-host-death family protein
MDLTRDIHPLTDFKRHTPEFLRQLRESGHPLVLTVNGKAEIVVQDAKSYQRLLDLVERGEGRPMDVVFDALEKTLRAKARP